MLAAVRSLMDTVKADVLSRWDFYQHKRLLKKMNWTEEAYQRQMDPDVNRRAGRVSQYYHGYPHVYIYTSSNVDPFTRFKDWSNAYAEMTKWCNEQCRGKTRNDILRIYEQTFIGINSDIKKEWFISDIGGGDALCFAFQDSRDYSMFLLKWS